MVLSPRNPFPASWNPESIKPHEWVTILAFALLAAGFAFGAGYLRPFPPEFLGLLGLADILSLSGHLSLFIISSATVMLTLAYFLCDISMFAARKISIGKTKIERLGDYLLFMLLASLFVMGLIFANSHFLQDSLFGKFAISIFFFSITFSAVWVFMNQWMEVDFGYIIVSLAVLFLSFSAAIGEHASRHQINRAEEASLLLKSGVCIQRRVIASTSSGYILFGAAAQIWEFRERSEIAVLSRARTCV